MKNKYFVYLVIIGFFLNYSFSAFCEEKLVLNLDLNETIKRSIKTSEEIQIEANNVEKSASIYQQARSVALPQVNGEVSLNHNAKYPSVLSTPKLDNELYTGVTASQLICSFGKVSSAIKQAQEAINVSRLQEEATTKDIIFNAKVSYYTALLAQQTYDIYEQSYKNALSNKDLLRERTYAGRGSKRDNIKIDADVASRMPGVNNAKANLLSSYKTLKKVVGVDPEREICLTEGFAQAYNYLDYEALEEIMFENETSLKILEKSIRIDNLFIREKRAGYLPTVSAFWSVYYQGARNEDIEFKDSDLGYYDVVGLKVDVPLWTSGRTTAELKEAKKNKENDELLLQKTRKDLEVSLAKTVSEYNEYIETLKANREAVRLAQESFKMTQDLFSSGQVTTTELNDAELLLSSQRLNEALTFYNLNVTLSKIERLTAEIGEVL
jgi:outer membrane protein TolC